MSNIGDISLHFSKEHSLPTSGRSPQYIPSNWVVVMIEVRGSGRSESASASQSINRSRANLARRRDDFASLTKERQKSVRLPQLVLKQNNKQFVLNRGEALRNTWELIFDVFTGHRIAELLEGKKKEGKQKGRFSYINYMHCGTGVRASESEGIARRRGGTTLLKPRANTQDTILCTKQGHRRGQEDWRISR